MKTNARPALSLEDRQQIQESVLRLSYTYGEGDTHGFLALFSEAAALEVAWFDVISTRIEGRSALATWISDLHNLYWTVPCSHVWVGNVLVEASADGAATRCLFNRLGLEGQSISTGTWKISHRKIDGQWSIDTLQIFVDGSQEEFAAKQALAAVHAEQARRSR